LDLNKHDIKHNGYLFCCNCSSGYRIIQIITYHFLKMKKKILCFYLFESVINSSSCNQLLSASDVNSRHDDIITSDGYSASYRQIIRNDLGVLERGENLL